MATKPTVSGARQNEAPKIEFSGSPHRYRQIAIWLTALIVAWLYGAFTLIQYAAYGQTWPLGWKPVLITIVFGAWFARFFYRSMMRLDARYGRGSGWTLVRRQAKFPELPLRPSRLVIRQVRRNR